MDKIRTSEYAQKIIDNPIWDESFEDMKKDLFEQFCSNTDLHTRERISLAIDILDDLRTKIESKMVEGMSLKIVGDNNGN